jgi:hypothetical protein
MNDVTHPRSQRRRDLANSLHIPAELATPFTEGEMAALKIIADEHVRCGACTLARDTITALSCTSRTVVTDAIRTAEAAGLLKREQIRGRGRRYTNITIIWRSGWRGSTGEKIRRCTTRPPVPALVHTVNRGSAGPRWRRDRRVARGGVGHRKPPTGLLPEKMSLSSTIQREEDPSARHFKVGFLRLLLLDRMQRCRR